MKYIKFLFIILFFSNYAHAMDLQSNLASLEINLTLLENQLPALDMLKDAIDVLFQQDKARNPIDYFETLLKDYTQKVDQIAQIQDEKEIINAALKKQTDDLIKVLNGVDTNKENRNQISTISRLIAPVFIKTLEKMSNIDFSNDIQKVKEAQIAMFKNYITDADWQTNPQILTDFNKIQETLGDIYHYQNISNDIDTFKETREYLENREIIYFFTSKYLSLINEKINKYKDDLKLLPTGLFTRFKEDLDQSFTKKQEFNLKKNPNQQTKVNLEEILKNKDAKKFYDRTIYNFIKYQFSNSDGSDKIFYAILLDKSFKSQVIDDLSIKASLDAYLSNNKDLINKMTEKIEKEEKENIAFTQTFETIFDTTMDLKEKINSIILKIDQLHAIEPETVELFNRLKENLAQLPLKIKTAQEKTQAEWLLKLLTIQYQKPLDPQKAYSLSRFISLSKGLYPKLHTTNELTVNLFDFIEFDRDSFESTIQIKNLPGILTIHPDSINKLKIENIALWRKIEKETSELFKLISTNIDNMNRNEPNKKNRQDYLIDFNNSIQPPIPNAPKDLIKELDLLRKNLKEKIDAVKKEIEDIEI